MGYVYILKNSKGNFYIGSTTDLKRRISQHYYGHTYSTKRMKDLVMVFSQKSDSLKVARNIECRLKKLKRKDYIEKIIKDGYIKMKPK